MKHLMHFLIIALTLVLLSGCIEEKQGTQVPTSGQTPAVTTPVTVPVSSQATATAVSDVTPTGKKELIELDNRRVFNPQTIKIEPGDEIFWNNIQVDTLILVSEDGLFSDQELRYDQKYQYIFNKIGTYRFYLKNNKSLNGTIIVEYPGKAVLTPVPSSTAPKEFPPGSIYVSARMLKPGYWSSTNNYGLDSLKIDIDNQIDEKLKIKAQIVSDNSVLEENSFVLERIGSSIEYANDNKHFINSTNVTLRLLIDGYLPAEYPFKIVDALN